jgi:two-component system sensor histidine kinase YesM
LQPIVENSYKYAFKECNDCKIKISGRLNGSVLEFCVSDNGIGIEPEKLEEIKEKISQFEMTEAGQYFGLGSTDRRIKIQYGRQYGLSIESTYLKGTKVTFRYPIV